MRFREDAVLGNRVYKEHVSRELVISRVTTLPPQAVLRVPRLLLLAVPEEFEQPDHVLVPHEHRKTAQISPTPHLSQPPVDPPDPVSVFEADPYGLSRNGEELLVLYTPYPPSLYPFWEHLLFGDVLLDVTSSLPPGPYLLCISPFQEMPLAKLPAYLPPRRGYEIL